MWDQTWGLPIPVFLYWRTRILCLQEHVFQPHRPSTFTQMTARALGDLAGILFELFVDGGMAGDSFDEMLQKTCTLLQQIWETSLLLSASKSKFFILEAIFASGHVGKGGIKADLTKLTAVADWRRPEDLQNLSAFLGLTGYFWSLVKGYEVTTKMCHYKWHICHSNISMDIHRWWTMHIGGRRSLADKCVLTHPRRSCFMQETWCKCIGMTLTTHSRLRGNLYQSSLALQYVVSRSYNSFKL